MIDPFCVRLVAASASVIVALPGLAQSGAIDPAFQPRFETLAHVAAVASLDNGQLLVGGRFHSVAGTDHYGLVRLNADGTVDPSFTPAVEGLMVQSIAVQPDGRILLGGFLSWLDQQGYPSVARLLPDGSADDTFIRDCVVEYSDVRSLVVCPDGRILVGGFFGYVGRNLPWPQEAHFLNRVARLNPDGTVDTDFNPGTAAETAYCAVDALALSPSGSIYVAGDFTSFNGLAKPHLVRLRPDGSVDPSFETWAGPDGPVTAVAVQADGRLLIGGTFTRVNGIARNGVARLDIDGAVDTTFRPEVQGAVSGLSLDLNGTIVVTERLQDGGIHLTRLHSDGTIAGRSEDSLRRWDGWPIIECLRPRSSGGFVVGGIFDQVGPTALSSIAAFDPADRLEPGFVPELWQEARVSAAVARTDGDVVVCGNFKRINGAAAVGVARLNHQGKVDPSFDASQIPAGVTYALTDLSDASILMGGFYRYRDGRSAPYLLHVLPDGTLDDTYPLVLDGVPRAFWRASDGKLLIGGEFYRANKALSPGLIRLNSDGSRDPSFNLGEQSYRSTFAITTQTTGKVLVGGNWQAQGSLDRAYLTRLNIDGSPDPSFVLEADLDSIVTALATDAEDRILVGGWFRQVNGHDQPGLIRLFADGSIDPGFQPALGRFSQVEALHVLADGRILVTGEVYPQTDQASQGVALLLADGSMDPGFAAPFPAARMVRAWATAAASDEEAILSTSCYYLDGKEHSSLSRLFVSGNSAVRLSRPHFDETGDVGLNALILGPAPSTIVVEHSANCVSWNHLSTDDVNANPMTIHAPAEKTGPVFFRARAQ